MDLLRCKQCGHVGRGPHPQGEALWTEYAKAALVGVVGFDNLGGMADKFVGRAVNLADLMLEAHKKRWGHD